MCYITATNNYSASQPTGFFLALNPLVSEGFTTLPNSLCPWYHPVKPSKISLSLCSLGDKKVITFCVTFFINPRILCRKAAGIIEDTVEPLGIMHNRGIFQDIFWSFFAFINWKSILSCYIKRCFLCQGIFISVGESWMMLKNRFSVNVQIF